MKKKTETVTTPVESNDDTFDYITIGETTYKKFRYNPMSGANTAFRFINANFANPRDEDSINELYKHALLGVFVGNKKFESELEVNNYFADKISDFLHVRTWALLKGLEVFFACLKENPDLEVKYFD